MRKNDIIATLVLRQIKGIGAVAIKNLWQKSFFQNEDFYQTIDDCLNALKKEVSDNEIENYIKEAQEIIFSSENENIKILHIADPSYPIQLSELKDAPAILFAKGNFERMEKVVGIIGTREPDRTGLEVSKRIASYFHEGGYSICNGLALGIDEGSIKRETNILPHVIGVLAGGLNYNQSKTLSKTTALLAEQVLDAGGLLISEYENNVKEDTFKIIKSCRIQAGLSQGLVLIQSRLNGGSKYTLEAFCTLNRPIGIIHIKDRQEDPLYEANKEIVENYKEGLSKMTGVKLDKITLEKINVISSKADYPLFDNEIIAKSVITNNLFKLF